MRARDTADAFISLWLAAVGLVESWYQQAGQKPAKGEASLREKMRQYSASGMFGDPAASAELFDSLDEAYGVRHRVLKFGDIGAATRAVVGRLHVALAEMLRAELQRAAKP